MIIPFSYESFAQNQNFFGRNDEINNINSIIKTSNNILLFSKRRMGKSSLIKKIFENKKDAICIYIDIFDITSTEDFTTYLLKAIAKSQKGDIKQIVTKLTKLFKRITFGIQVDPNNAEISYMPKLNDLNFKDSMEEIFNSLFLLAKEKKVILAIDEFQQIALFKDKRIDATLRKYMQENHNISYIFLGSKRHILNELFMYKSPLFEMATPIELGSINDIDIFNYVKKYLQITKDTIDYLIYLSEGETKLLQHICHILYRDYKDENIIVKEHIDKALLEILNAKSSTYCVLFDTLTLPQKKAFKILTSQDGNYFTIEVLKKYNILKTSLESAFKQLFKKELIDKEDGKYFVPDRAFELWGRELLK
jgi:hypothetical protein